MRTGPMCTPWVFSCSPRSTVTVPTTAAKILSMLDAAGIEAMTRVQRPASRLGCFAQDEFAIDLAAGTVVCPAGMAAAIKARKDGSRIAKFGDDCHVCLS